MADIGGELSTSWDMELLRALSVDPSEDMFGLPTSYIPDMDIKVLHTEDLQLSTQSEKGHLSSQEKAEEGAHSALCPDHRSVVQSETEDSINSDVDELLFNCGSESNCGQKGDSYSTYVKEFLAQQQDTLGKIGNSLKQRKEVLSFFENIEPDTFYLVSKTEAKEIMVLPVSEEMFSKSFYEKGVKEEETQSTNEDLSGNLQHEPNVRSDLEKDNMTVPTSPSTGKKLAFTCTCCPRQEATRSSLLTHLLSHGRPFCRLCFATYSSKWSLERHLRVRHPSSKLKPRIKILPASSPAKILVTSRYGRRRQVISASRLNGTQVKPSI